MGRKGGGGAGLPKPQNIPPSENKITATGPDQRRRKRGRAGGGTGEHGRGEEINNMLVSINLASI